MEVVNEADAPALPPAAPPLEGEEAAAAPSLAEAPAPSLAEAPAPSLAEAPAPPPPEAKPVEPALPANATEPDDEALPFQRPTFRTVLAARLWAGLLGAGAWLWFTGVLGGLAIVRLVPRLDRGLHLSLAFVAALVVVMARGFRAPVRSYGDLAGRLLGALFFGVLWLMLAALLVVLLSSGARLHDREELLVAALLGLVMSGLALARVHGIGAEKPRRIKIAAALAAALFVSCWPALPSWRCWLGFSEGCRAAADSSGEQGDYRAAGAFGARGCRGEDSLSCRLAGQAYQSDGPERNLRLAEGFFREGCALGDPTSCERVHGIEIERRCDRYGASACIELAQAHSSGTGVERSDALALRFYRKACLLGAEDACKSADRYRYR